MEKIDHCQTSHSVRRIMRTSDFRRARVAAILIPIFVNGHAQNGPGSTPSGIMLMNRLGPSSSELYIANADGSGERKLSTGSDFEYNATFSADGSWIVFTSELDAHGQADIYRMHPDGSGRERAPRQDDEADRARCAPLGSEF